MKAFILFDLSDNNIFYFRILFCLVLLSCNLFLKLKTLRAPIDYDTASHLYFAYLKKNKIKFLHQYFVGIKYLIPRLYYLFYGILDGKPWRFRVFNIFSSSLIIIFWFFSNPNISINEIPFYFLGVLLINSLWVNYLTSASEFHESVFIILIIIVPQFLPFEIAWFVQVLLFIIAFAGFKLINILYFIPLILFNASKIQGNELEIIVGIVLISILAVIGLRNSISSTKSYTKTRKWLHIKSKSFIKSSPLFCLMLLLLGIGNIYFGTSEWIVLQIIIWIIFISQRSYIAYFYYPMTAIGFFIAFQIGWLSGINFWIGIAISAAVFYFHNLKNIIIISARESDIIMRTKIFLNFNWKEYLDNRDLQVQWLKNNIDKKSKVYLWGSHVALLLLSGLTHSPNTYYNHNHLMFWSVIKDKKQYAMNYILNEKPLYVIESMIMKNVAFPAEELKEHYFLFSSIKDMNVYKRKV